MFTHSHISMPIVRSARPQCSLMRMGHLLVYYQHHIISRALHRLAHEERVHQDRFKLLRSAEIE